MADDNDTGGYGNPPKSTRFKPGQSGNPKGRPPGRRNDELPYDSVLGQPVLITEDGVETSVTAETAFLRKLAASGQRDSGTAIDLLNANEAMEKNAVAAGGPVVSKVMWQIKEPGCPNEALDLLGMAKPLYRGQPNAYMAIEPWLVEEALSRLGDVRFTRQEQETIIAATRTPHKVNWPDWWEAIPPKRR